jgi:hypothetical protein
VQRGRVGGGSWVRLGLVLGAGLVVGVSGSVGATPVTAGKGSHEAGKGIRAATTPDAAMLAALPEAA